ncbi:hypothetical protein NQ318_000107 [Aromia moschata]|uniref:Transposase n=1 Tax=Aromia moschata TaxID=1265417 RepID=A0AAV8XGD2_9CUCU|nr:hypothetical protein NQ318_000107 [Aromia moschata]
MLLVYGEVRKNRREAKALYGQRYPDRAQPHDKYFPWLERHLKTERIEEEPDEFIVSEEAEINTLACIEVDPTTSVRQIAANIGIGRESVRNILKKHKFKPFKYQLHHHLYEADHQRRLEFCNWFMAQQRPNLSRFILFSLTNHASRIWVCSIKNNSRYWARENPHLFRQGAFQERFGVNVWMGVIGTRIIGPIFFENPVTADQYLQFLSNEIADFFENLPINEYFHIYYQQDEAPAYNARRVRDHLNQTFEDHWIGTYGPVRWPARSCDITPLEFFYWSHIKEAVYRTQPTDLQDLRDRITRAVNNITPAQMENVLRDFENRIHLCHQMNGGQFEHLIYG